jgi:methylmalonyl-CoA mutase cobalamin-binding domain/chain
VMDGLVDELLTGAREEIARVEEQGGAVEAVPYMKAALVESHRERIGRIERGDQVLVGVNRYEETEPSPLTEDGGIMVVDPAVEAEAIEALSEWRSSRDAGMEVVYEGIRLTPSQIARSAVDEGVHVIGLSILSGSHRELIPDVIAALREAGGSEIPLVVGGIIPDADAAPLRAAGVAAVYTPKDFELTRILRDVVAIVAERNGIASAAA